MNRSGRNDETWYDGAQNATYPNPILRMERLLEKSHPLMDDGEVIEIAAPIGRETGSYKFMTKTRSGRRICSRKNHKGKRRNSCSNSL
jgi:hypothetical protein